MELGRYGEEEKTNSSRVGYSQSRSKWSILAIASISLFPLRLQPRIRHALKGFGLSGHEKSAIVKADRDPAIVAALNNLADLTLQRDLGFPCESLRDQSNAIANFETIFRPRLIHFSFAPG
jgi:hypothetical protein